MTNLLSHLRIWRMKRDLDRKLAWRREVRKAGLVPHRKAAR